MTPNWWHRTARRSLPRGFILAGALATGWYANGATRAESSAMGPVADSGATPDYFSSRTVAGGQRISRFDTFGNEPFWTDTLHLNEVVETAVDPATTVALLKLNAIVGVMAEVDAKNHITRLGIDIRRAPDRVGPKLAALRAYYDRIRGLKLTAQQRRDLVEYLKSR